MTLNVFNVYDVINSLHQRDKSLHCKVQDYTLRKNHGKLFLHVPLLRTGNGVYAETTLRANRSGKIISSSFGIEEMYLGLYFYNHQNTIKSVSRIEMHDGQKSGYDVFMVIHKPFLFSDLVVTYVPDIHTNVLDWDLLADNDHLPVLNGVFTSRDPDYDGDEIPSAEHIVELIESYDLNRSLIFRQQLTAA